MLGRPSHERAAALVAACGEDEALQAEVQSLLDQPESAAAFLSTPAAAIAAGLVSQPEALEVGSRLSRYTISVLPG